MLAHVTTFTIDGLDSRRITVEVDLRRGLPAFTIVGRGDAAVRESLIGDHQRLPGYCVLLHDGEADHLTDLPRPQRTVFLEDLALLGEAVMSACARLDSQLLRINYEVLGNAYPHLHGHLFPRYLWEADDMRRGPVWRYPDLHDPRYELGPQHDHLRAALVDALGEVLPHS